MPSHFDQIAAHIVAGISTKAESQIEFEIVEALEEVCRAWQAEQGWRDIASAPTDGSWILGLTKGGDVRKISWGQSRNSGPQWCTTVGWIVAEYWMSLPDPPAPAATEE